jgi:hypothetical protein
MSWVFISQRWHSSEESNVEKYLSRYKVLSAGNIKIFFKTIEVQTLAICINPYLEISRI